jgi:hypothetical protein
MQTAARIKYSNDITKPYEQWTIVNLPMPDPVGFSGIKILDLFFEQGTYIITGIAEGESGKTSDGSQKKTISAVVWTTAALTTHWTVTFTTYPNGWTRHDRSPYVEIAEYNTIFGSASINNKIVFTGIYSMTRRDWDGVTNRFQSTWYAQFIYVNIGSFANFIKQRNSTEYTSNEYKYVYYKQRGLAYAPDLDLYVTVGQRHAHPATTDVDVGLVMTSKTLTANIWTENILTSLPNINLMGIVYMNGYFVAWGFLGTIPDSYDNNVTLGDTTGIVAYTNNITENAWTIKQYAGYSINQIHTSQEYFFAVAASNDLSSNNHSLEFWYTNDITKEWQKQQAKTAPEMFLVNSLTFNNSYVAIRGYSRYTYNIRDTYLCYKLTATNPILPSISLSQDTVTYIKAKSA